MKITLRYALALLLAAGAAACGWHPAAPSATADVVGALREENPPPPPPPPTDTTSRTGGGMGSGT